MQLSSLITKLNKLGVKSEIVDINGYNKDLAFTINGTKYYAAFTSS